MEQARTHRVNTLLSRYSSITFFPSIEEIVRRSKDLLSVQVETAFLSRICLQPVSNWRFEQNI